jgi:4-amino-4-deoxy-L-arabinose transferase-like glycosyltransferase
VARVPRIALALAGVALALRLALVLGDLHVQLNLDALDFNRHAASIAQGDGYPEAILVTDRDTPTAIRPPLYPYLLGAVYKLAPGTVTPARMLGALLGALTVLLVFLIVDRVWGRREAIAAGAIAVAFPPFLALVTSLNTESLFVPLELATVLALLACIRSRGHVGWAMAAGALCGLAAITRGNGFVLVPALVMGLYAATGRGQTRRWLVLVAAALLALVLVLTPWTVRNVSAFDGKLIPVTTSTGYALQGTYNDLARRGEGPGAKWQWRPPHLDPENRGLYARRGITEADINGELSRRGREYILDHPGYAIEATALNTWRLVFPLALPSLTDDSYDAFSVPDWLRPLATWGYLLVAALAVIGLVMAVRRHRTGPLWMWTIPVLLALSFAILNGDPRYRTTVDPFLIMLAGVAVAGLTARLQSAVRSSDG